jgi:thiosulfate/3-mercaptopyruvate sulfurtransferase
LPSTELSQIIEPGGASSLQRHFLFGRVFVLLVLFGVSSALRLSAADSTNLKTLTPEELLRVLNTKSGKAPTPLLFQVGSHMLYVQAHIPGSEYIGQGNTPDGLQRLANRVSKLPKKTAIILYCGCCPWSHCPNVNPAYEALEKLGFTNVKVLYMANNFGVDWVYKGYPVAKGE